MSYVRSTTFDRIVSLPLGTPETEIRAGDSLSLGSIRLVTGQRFSLRWLSLQLSKIETVEPYTSVSAGTAVLRSSSLGLAYIGLYAGSAVLTRPTGVPICILSLADIGYKMANPYYFREFSCPDTYELVLTNNTTNVAISASALASVKLHL